MRNRLETLIRDWMEEDEMVVFLTADIGGGLFKNLKGRYPERTINVGIAEQNMIGMAAGLSSEGFRVICYSKACFISLRVVDQIKNALCYASKPVMLIAADAGYDEADAGYPHISLEDLGIIRSLAQIGVYVPTTYAGLDYSFGQMKKSLQPSYMRLNKARAEEDICSIDKVVGGCYYLKRDGLNSDTLNITNGCSAVRAMNEATGDILALDDFQVDEDALLNVITKYSEVFVWEEQFADNGIYEMLCRLLIEKRVISVKIGRIGPKKEYLHICMDRSFAEQMERV